MIRGAKNDIFTNIRNLLLIFGITAAALPIVNAIYGDDLFAKGCKTVQISMTNVQAMLNTRNAKLSTRTDDLYEDFDIYDSGAKTAPSSDMSDAIAAQTNETETVIAETVTTGVHTGNNPISAMASGKDVIYVYSDESRMRRKDGTRAWRNNNPGNIRPGSFSRNAGGIGQAGNFAVFPDESTGMDAIVALLKTGGYQSKTLGGAIHAWAPPSDGNNTAAYQRRIEQAIGASLDTPLKNLTEAQLRQVASEIRRVEGWRPGTEIRKQGK